MASVRRTVALALILGVTVAAKPAKTPPVAAPAVVTDPGAALALIDAALAEGRTEAARDLIVRSSDHAQSPEFQLRQAEVVLQRGQLAEAAAMFAKLGDTPAVAARAKQGLGVASLRLGDRDGAIAALDAALALDPKLFRAWSARGVAADRGRDWDKAEACYAKAIELDPRSATVLSNRGYSRLLRGQYGEAEADLLRATALDPKLGTARTNLRLARAMQGNYQAAFAGADKKELATDLNTVGFAAMSRGDYAVAESYFNRAMELNPQFDRTAWANLQYLKQLSGKPPGQGADN